MLHRGDITLAQFPFTDLTGAKLRPVLILAVTAGLHRDFLVMFISSQLYQAVPSVDMVLDATHPAFAGSGLKAPSVFKVTKIATLSESLIVGPVGHLDRPVFDDLIGRVVDWVQTGRAAFSP
jgi:mRNA interferase MazF